MYFDGLFYHVYNRGAHKVRIFLSNADFDYCFRLLRKYESKYKITIVSYCLMPNHYHMVLRQEPSGSISRFIQTTFNAYSQGFNLKHKHSGTLFQGKAKRRLIADERVPVVVRYLHINPVRAQLMQEPQDWKFSDCRHWLGLSDSSMAHRHVRERYFSSGEDYREFLKELL